MTGIILNFGLLILNFCKSLATRGLKHKEEEYEVYNFVKREDLLLEKLYMQDLQYVSYLIIK